MIKRAITAIQSNLGQQYREVKGNVAQERELVIMVYILKLYESYSSIYFQAMRQ